MELTVGGVDLGLVDGTDYTQESPPNPVLGQEGNLVFGFFGFFLSLSREALCGLCVQPVHHIVEKAGPAHVAILEPHGPAYREHVCLPAP